MTRFLLLLVSAAALQPGVSAAALQGRIVDEAGRALPTATVFVQGVAIPVDESGRFETSVDEAPVTLRVAVEGYYEIIHTLGSTDGTVADITLVQRRPGRQLLMFAGDTMLSRRYFQPRAGEPALVREGHAREDGAALLQHIAPYVRLADLASLNLETQLAEDEPAVRLPKSVTFYSPPALAGLVKDAGFDYVALGNNHMYDYAAEGLRSTLQAVSDAGLTWSGAGLTESTARQAHVDKGSPFAFLSYVGWAGGFEPNQVAEPGKGGAALGGPDVFAADLAALASRPTVVQYHSGLEYVEKPPMRERTSLRSAIDSGADLAIGHHPHVIQGFELHAGKLISFSLGNFLFDQYHYETQLGMLLYVWMDGDEFHRAEVVPLHINGYVPTPASGAIRFAVLNRLARLSAPYGVCLQATGAHAAIVPGAPEASCGPQVLADPARWQGRGPVSLRQLGLSPLQPVVVPTAASYRVGVDILRRGDFSYVGRFGTVDRAWIEDDRVRVEQGDNPHLRIDVAPGGGPVRGGMRVFQRVFRASNPATVSGRVHLDGDLEVRVLLQRRRTDEGLDDALLDGPVTEIGRLAGTGWQYFALDYDQPRIATRAVRLLLEVRSIRSEGGAALFDDLAWIEWHTPWLRGPEAAPAFGGHVAVRSTN